MIRVEEGVIRSMVDLSLSEYPLEACGILAGRDRQIHHFIPCTNQLRSPSAFSIPPQELFEAFRSIRALGLQLQGIFHSHPQGGLSPSLRDRREFHYPAASYWIVSLQKGEPVVGCFEWVHQQFVPAPFAVLEPAAPGATLSETQGAEELTRARIEIGPSRLFGRERADGSAERRSELASEIVGVAEEREPGVFRGVKDLAPPDLLEFLERCAGLLPEDTRYRLRMVVDSAGTAGDPLHRVLEVVRRQWEGLQYENDIQIALVGPARTGKSTLLSAISGGEPDRVSSIFRIIDLQGLSEYLGYDRNYGADPELENVDVIVLVLDAAYGFTDDTGRMVQEFVRSGQPVLLAVNKIDLVEKPRLLLKQVRRRFRLPVVGVSARKPETVQRILKGIVSVHPRALYSLGRRLPAFRRTICRGIVTQASFGSGLVAALPIPIGDILPLSAIQTSMLLKIAKAHGFRINRERARELLPILAAGVLVRDGVQRLRPIFPAQTAVVSISVAGIWTFLVGQAAVEYFERLCLAAERGERPLAGE